MTKVPPTSQEVAQMSEAPPTQQEVAQLSKVPPTEQEVPQMSKAPPTQQEVGQLSKAPPTEPDVPQLSKAPPTQQVPQTTKAQPTQQGFDKLLAWLDPDREKAGAKYNKIQSRLIGVFSCFGCDAENLADETINVVVSKIDRLIENYVGDPALYFYGVAKKIYLERRGKKPPPIIPPPDDSSEEEEQIHDCLEESLDELSPDDKKVVLQYHEGEKQEKIKNRTKLARDLGISRNALRIKVYRLHAGLRQRVQERLNQLRPH